jgi:hypothetical protein
MSGEPPAAAPSFPERSLAVRRAAVRLCVRLGWAPVHEMPLPNGRRADIFALCPDGGFACIEIKSGPRDFLTDGKWPEYQDFCDTLYFAVDDAFPLDLLPQTVGLIVAGGGEAEVVREAQAQKLVPARRRGLLQKFAWIAALRLAAIEDPTGMAGLRAALRAD